MTAIQKLEKSSMFQNLFHSMIKNFFDQVDIEINGKRRGNVLKFFKFNLILKRLIVLNFNKGDFQVKNEKVYSQWFRFVIGIDPSAIGDSYVNDYW